MRGAVYGFCALLGSGASGALALCIHLFELLLPLCEAISQASFHLTILLPQPPQEGLQLHSTTPSKISFQSNQLVEAPFPNTLILTPILVVISAPYSSRAA